MGKKLTNLNRFISVIIDIDEKWFVIFEHTINHLFLAMFVYLNLNTIFHALFLFYYFFFLLLPMLSIFKCIQSLSD